jgi:dTDP-4-amino-4,6-dideoxygalactose transaminase
MTLREALAIDGGTPVRTAPMRRWPAPAAEEIAQVTEVLRTGRLNYWTGEQGRELEREYALTLGRKHAIAVANGTLALELALRAFGIGPGDEVVVPARTFIATAGVVVAVGAVPVIADIEAESSCISAATVERVLTERTRAVLPVHLGGWPVDMKPIARLAERRGIVVIEDCAQAHGGALAGHPVGNMHSHAGAFSFCQDKILPTGEGGILVLDDDDAYQRAWEYKDHGKSLRKVTDPAFAGAGTSYQWLVDSFGTNWRLDEMAAALGRVGLAKLPAWHNVRTNNALRLAEALAGLSGLTIPLPSADTTHAFYRLYGLVDPEALASGWDRDRILSAIAAEGVPIQYGTCAEIYREEAFARAGFGPAERLPVASRVHESSIAFFVHPTLGPAEIDDTIAATRKVMEAATR